MKHRFVYEFEDDSPFGDFQVDLDTPSGARIKFDLDGQNIWLSANRAGWLHLARICSEMAHHTGFKPGYHFHRTYEWQDNPSSGPEMSADEKE